MSNIKDLVESQLKKYVSNTNCLEKTLIESMKYSLLGNGKRIRAILVCEFCKLCNGNVEKALPFACAIEMIHAYSLIHDDLPCIDNDDMRRGKPSNHVVFGQDIALLSGDALLTLAFEVMLAEKTIKEVGYETACKSARILAKRSGMFGMIGGQVIDIQSQGQSTDLDKLKIMDQKKTGELICAAAEIGCTIAGADPEKTKNAINYAINLGLAFQIMDDILDVTSSSEVFGKPINSDKEKNKSTYVSLLGLEKSKNLVISLTDSAISSLEKFDNDTSYLKKLALDLSKRKK